MSGFTSPNHTQTPNDLFDVHMKDMTEAELKVTLAIVRKTLGYHKKHDPISLTQLEEMTGLSRRACIEGADYAIKRGLIERVGSGKRGVIIYGLVINSNQSEINTSDNLSPDKASTSAELSPVTSDKLSHTKESSKEKELKKPRQSARAVAKASKTLQLKQEKLDKYDATLQKLCRKFKPDVDWTMIRPRDMYEKELERYIDAAEIFESFGLTADDLPGMFKYLDAKGWPSYGIGKIAECAPDYAGYKARQGAAKKIIQDNPALDLSTPVEVVPILMQREKIVSAAELVEDAS